jgi:ribosomal protein S18 acetylase RimI-like enzyme
VHPPALRPASPEEAAEVAAIFIRCWRSAYRDIVADEIIDGLAPREVEAWWRSLIEDPASHVVVARGDGGVIGMARFGSDPDDEVRGHLFSLYVDPATSGAGIGRALLEHVTAHLSAAGYETATLWVFAANERAIRLYRAAGWEPDGAERIEQQWNAPELRLTRALAQRAEP